MQPCGTHQRSSSVHSSSAGKLDNQRCKDPQLRDPQKLSEKWRIHCASIRLDEHGCRCCISLSIIFSAIFQDVFRFLLLSARLSMNAKMAWAIWMVQNGRSPNPDKPWQITNSPCAEIRSFGIILRCSFTWGWKIWLFGHPTWKNAAENHHSTPTCPKVVDLYGHNLRSHIIGFKNSTVIFEYFWLTSQPSPGAEASWWCAERAPAVPASARPTPCIPRLWSPGPSLRMGMLKPGSPWLPMAPHGSPWLPHLSTDLGLSWSPVSRCTAWKACSVNQSLQIRVVLGLV